MEFEELDDEYLLNINDILPNEILQIILKYTTYRRHGGRLFDSKLVCRKWRDILNYSMDLKMICYCISKTSFNGKLNNSYNRKKCININDLVNLVDLPNISKNIKYVNLETIKSFQIILNAIQALRGKTSNKCSFEISLDLKPNEELIMEEINGQTLFNDYKCFWIQNILFNFRADSEPNTSIEMIRYLIQKQPKIKSIKLSGYPSKIILEMLNDYIVGSLKYSVQKLQLEFQSASKESLEDSNIRLEQLVLHFPHVTHFYTQIPNVQCISKWENLVNLEMFIINSTDISDYTKWNCILPNVKYFTLKTPQNISTNDLIRSISLLSMPNLVKSNLPMIPDVIELEFSTLCYFITPAWTSFLKTMNNQYTFNIPLISNDRIKNYREMFMKIIPNCLHLMELDGYGIGQLLETKSYQILKYLPESVYFLDHTYSDNCQQFLNLNLSNINSSLFNCEEFKEMIEIMNNMKNKDFRIYLEGNDLTVNGNEERTLLMENLMKMILEEIGQKDTIKNFQCKNDCNPEFIIKICLTWTLFNDRYRKFSISFM